MFKLFGLVALFIHVLNIVQVGARLEEGQPEGEKNDSSEEENGYTYERFVYKNSAQLSLGCILFQSKGCDIECFVTANAFERLGAGVCVKDNRCDCDFASDLSLEGLWREKFPNSDEILEEIKSNHVLANKIQMIIAERFTTAKQTWIALLDHLNGTQKKNLKPVDTTPAAKIVLGSTHYSLDEIKKHVARQLPNAMKPYKSESLTTTEEYKFTLVKVLDDAKQNMEIFHQIVHMVRRLKNKHLNDVVTEYLRTNHIDEIVDNDFVIAVDRISYVVDEELIKKIDQGTIPRLLGWFKTGFIYFLNRFRTNENDPTFAEVLAKPGPINRDWREDSVTIRYRRNPQGDINLTWVKESNRVCIFKSATDVVNQSWLFDGEVFISLSRSSLGSMSQYWDFGEVAYEYYKDSKTAGQSYGKWRNEKAREDILKYYEEKIKTWCTQNDF